jgi:hypothetical protein
LEVRALEDPQIFGGVVEGGSKVCVGLLKGYNLDLVLLCAYLELYCVVDTQFEIELHTIFGVSCFIEHPKCVVVINEGSGVVLGDFSGVVIGECEVGFFEDFLADGGISVSYE